MALFTLVDGVRSVEVRGNHVLAAATIRSAADVPQGHPLVRLDTGAIAARVEQLPGIGTADVSTSFPSTVVITVSERVAVGVTRVDDISQLAEAVDEARFHDPKVLVEQGIEGREIECAVLGGRAGSAPRASVPGEIVVDHAEAEFYDFEAKYLSASQARTECPADLPADVAEKVRDIAARAFEAIGGEGISRVDVFVTEAGEITINEINTMPGFTPISMYPKMWEASGISYPELIDELIQLALERPLGLR